MLTALPENPRQLRRQLLWMLAAVGATASLVSASTAHLLATRHVERAAIERVGPGLAHFDSPEMQGLVRAQPGSRHADLLRVLEPEHFIGIRWRDASGVLIAEEWAAGLDPEVLRAARAARPRIAGDLLRWGDEAFVRAVRPLDEVAGSRVEAYYRLDPATVHTLDPLVRGAALIAGATALATTLVLYPVLLGLTRRALRLSQELLRSNLDLMRTLGSAIALRDSDTDAHNYRVTLYAIRLAQVSGIAPANIADLIAGAFLHDVGKIGIADAILLKPGPLTSAEVQVIQRHPLLGDHLVARSAWLARARPIVLRHHEHFDGSGYPDGLRGEQIPLGARIVAIADAYEAMVHGRPYQPSQPHERVADELRRLRGAQFDPDLVPVFLDELERDTLGVPPLVALPPVARLEPEFAAGA